MLVVVVFKTICVKAISVLIFNRYFVAPATAFNLNSGIHKGGVSAMLVVVPSVGATSVGASSARTGVTLSDVSRIARTRNRKPICFARLDIILFSPHMS